MRRFLVLSFCFITFRLWAQTITEYKPVEVSKDSIYLDEKKFKKDLHLTGFEGLPKEATDEAKDVYYHRRKEYVDKIKNHECITDPVLTTYLQKTFKNILTASNIPQRDSFKLNITRSFIANAYSTGDWNIYFNIGLLSKLENESQVAFVLCHEISHQLLRHTDIHILSFLKMKYSKDLKAEQKQISKTKYETADKMVDLLKKRVYAFTEHGREDEKGADSLGLLLLMKTDYDARESIRSLQILDSLDGDTFVVNYRKYFDGDPYRFKDSWTAKSKTLFFGGKAVYEFDEDSVKTHPDCPKREEYARAMLTAYSASGKQKNIQPANDFEVLRRACKFEEVEYMFFKKRYAYCLFHALHLSEEYPDDVYPVNTVAKCLGEIADLERNHKLYDHISKPAPNFEENYNQLLQLFDRATITDISQINSNYVNLYFNKFNSNTSFNTLFKKYDLITHKF